MRHPHSGKYTYRLSIPYYMNFFFEYFELEHRWTHLLRISLLFCFTILSTTILLVKMYKVCSLVKYMSSFGGIKKVTKPFFSLSKCSFEAIRNAFNGSKKCGDISTSLLLVNYFARAYPIHYRCGLTESMVNFNFVDFRTLIFVLNGILILHFHSFNKFRSKIFFYWLSLGDRRM